MKHTPFLFAFVLVQSLACAPTESKSANANVVQTTSDTSTTPMTSTPASDAIPEIGLLKAVEDAGYPFATLTIEFPERKFTETFTLNLEEVKTINMGVLNKSIGRYVSFEYTSDLINALLDIQKDGKSLLGDQADLPEDVKKASGTLSGADKETAGDLPGTITITTADKTEIGFEFFVTKELVEANNTDVVVFYDERTSNKISAIKVLAK